VILNNFKENQSMSSAKNEEFWHLRAFRREKKCALVTGQVAARYINEFSYIITMKKKMVFNEMNDSYFNPIEFDGFKRNLI
jgi:hypothetical protein